MGSHKLSPLLSFLPIALAGVLSLTPDALAQSIETEVDEIMASDGALNDWFGDAVDFNEDWVAVGAQYYIGGLGKVYLYTRGPVVQEIVLEPPPANAGQFGASLDLDGNTLLVGEPFFGLQEGRVHVYEFDGASWNLSQTLLGTGASGERFGASVSLDDSAGRFVVGAPTPTGSGYLEIFEHDGASWVSQRTLSVFGNPGDEFGHSVTVSGNYVAVGAPQADGQAGRTFVYEGAGASWSLVDTLIPSDGGEFGHVVCVQGSDLFVGAPHYSAGAPDEGGVYHYQRDGSGWNEITVLQGSVATANDLFGSALHVHDDVLAVGMPEFEDSGGVIGAVVQFRDQDGTWVEQQTLVQAASEPQDLFATAVAVHDDEVLVGSAYHAGIVASTGTVFVFDVPGLSLTALPEAPILGDLLNVETFGGAPGQGVGIFVVGVNDVPFFLPVVFGAFTAEGDYKVIAPYNDPSLTGLKVDLMSVGQNAAGKARVSPVETMQF